MLLLLQKSSDIVKFMSNAICNHSSCIHANVHKFIWNDQLMLSVNSYTAENKMMQWNYQYSHFHFFLSLCPLFLPANRLLISFSNTRASVRLGFWGAAYHCSPRVAGHRGSMAAGCHHLHSILTTFLPGRRSQVRMWYGEITCRSNFALQNDDIFAVICLSISFVTLEFRPVFI